MNHSFSCLIFYFYFLSYKKLSGWIQFFLVSLVLGIIQLLLRFSTCNKMLCTETYPLQGRLIPVSILLHTTTDYSMFLSCPKELCEYSFEQSDFVTVVNPITIAAYTLQRTLLKIAFYKVGQSYFVVTISLLRPLAFCFDFIFLFYLGVLYSPKIMKLHGKINFLMHK